MSNATSPLNLLFLTHNYPRHPGDFAGRFVARLAELAAARGHHVTVVAPHAPGSKTEEEADGVGVHRFRYAADDRERIAYRGELGQINLAGPQGIAAYAGFVRSFTRAAKVAISGNRPDVIHAHWWIPAGWIATRLGVETPLIVTMHGTDLRLLERKAWIRPLARRVFRRASVITVVSQSLADIVTGLFPAIRAKIQVTPMPANDAAFFAAAAESTPEPLILCVTRFTEQKRNHILLGALAQLSAAGINVRARLIGEGPLRSRLALQCAELGLSNRVEFAEPVPQDTLGAEYRRAAIVVLPAVNEGFGMVLVEAQLCGIPVVGARSGGIEDIVEHERTGLLVEPDSPDDLAAQLTRLVQDTELRRRLATAGRVSAESRFSSAAITDRFCGWYRSLGDRAA